VIDNNVAINTDRDNLNNISITSDFAMQQVLESIGRFAKFFGQKIESFHFFVNNPKIMRYLHDKFIHILVFCQQHENPLLKKLTHVQVVLDEIFIAFFKSYVDHQYETTTAALSEPLGDVFSGDKHGDVIDVVDTCLPEHNINNISTVSELDESLDLVNYKKESVENTLVSTDNDSSRIVTASPKITAVTGGNSDIFASINNDINWEALLTDLEDFLK
jgi:hypothetical protein